MWRRFYCVIEPRCKLFNTPLLTGEHKYKMQFYVFNFSVCTSKSCRCVCALYCRAEEGGCYWTRYTKCFNIFNYFFTLEQNRIYNVGLFGRKKIKVSLKKQLIFYFIVDQVTSFVNVCDVIKGTNMSLCDN